MLVSPLREAGDAAVQSLSAPVADAFELLRSGRMRLRTERRVGWQIVNLDLDGRRLRYRVTDNIRSPLARRATDGADEQVWAMSLHGYFAGGSMYARESENLAERFGWRVVNLSLPGFGGSDALGTPEVSIDQLTDQIALVKERLGIGSILLLGHSMGAAVAMHFAANHPDEVLGVVYRDGVATPAWQHRHGAVAKLLNGALPEVAPMADMAAAVALDLPDLLAGHAFLTIRSMIPDLRHNMKTLAHSAPIASMLMNLDLSADVRAVRDNGVPVLAEWGCFDRLIPPSTASEFSEVAGLDVHWVLGGHSWMLARPHGQADVLTKTRWGRAFLDATTRRAAALEVSAAT
jgi:pimeloyl-ACP methyl ester carboxylesterase